MSELNPQDTIDAVGGLPDIPRPRYSVESVNLRRQDPGEVCDCYIEDRKGFTRAFFADSRLCETCLELDIMHYPLRHSRGSRLLDLGPAEDIAERSTYSLCKLVYHLLPLNTVTKLGESGDFSPKSIELMPILSSRGVSFKV